MDVWYTHWRHVRWTVCLSAPPLPLSETSAAGPSPPRYKSQVLLSLKYRLTPPFVHLFTLFVQCPVHTRAHVRPCYALLCALFALYLYLLHLVFLKYILYQGPGGRLPLMSVDSTYILSGHVLPVDISRHQWIIVDIQKLKYLTFWLLEPGKLVICSSVTTFRYYIS